MGGTLHLGMPTLQSGVGTVPGRWFLASTPETVTWGRLPTEGDAAVLAVDPGDTITIDTISHEGILEDQGRDPVAYFGARGVPRSAILDDAISIAASGLRRGPSGDGPHIVTGPIAVRGARPGDMLSIEVLDLQLRVGYGLISNRHGRGALPGEFPIGDGPSCVFATVELAATGAMGCIEAGRGGRVIRFPLRPFLGLMGVATNGPERAHSVPPGRHGGNLDISLLGVGSVLHLPVQVDDACFYVGDPHFAQGDGEVALTAFEAPLRATVRVDVVPATDARARFGLTPRPTAETAELLVAIGLDRDLDEAARDCTRAALELLSARYDLDPPIALAYLSAAADFSVSQVVDDVKGVHAAIRRADFAAWSAAMHSHAG